MEVSNTEIMSTAVVGQMETEEFTIDNSAEFFEILSKSMYTYPLWAVIREMLTNAWDAHLEAGVDKPIYVDYSNEVLTIRDYGKGLPHDIKKMADIYVRYGKGTKRDKGNVTGGFGLGCKSPLGISDTFEVTTHQDGQASLYMITKASNRGNKPTINKVATFTSDTTGVEVRIPVVERNMVQYCTNMCWISGIKASVNCTDIEPLEVPSQGQLIRAADVDVPYMNTTVLVRYGNNVYPMPDIDTIVDTYPKDSLDWSREVALFKTMINFMDNYRSEGFKLVIQAKPNSLHLNPSREALSMSELTAKSLVDLILDKLDFYVNPDEETVTKYLAIIKNYIADNNCSLHVKPSLPSRNVDWIGVALYLKLTVTYEQYAEMLIDDVCFKAKVLPENRKYVSRFIKGRRLYKTVGSAYGLLLPSYIHAYIHKVHGKLLTDMYEAGGKLFYKQSDSIKPSLDGLLPYNMGTGVLVEMLTLDIKKVFTSKNHLKYNGYTHHGYCVQVKNKKDIIESVMTLTKAHSKDVTTCIPEPVKRESQTKGSPDEYLFTMASNTKLRHNQAIKGTVFEAYVHENYLYRLVKGLTDIEYTIFFNLFGSRIGVYSDTRIEKRKAYKEATSFSSWIESECKKLINQDLPLYSKLFSNSISEYRMDGEEREHKQIRVLQDFKDIINLPRLDSSSKGRKLSVLLACLYYENAWDNHTKDLKLHTKQTKRSERIWNFVDEGHGEQMRELLITINRTSSGSLHTNLHKAVMADVKRIIK